VINPRMLLIRPGVGAALTAPAIRAAVRTAEERILIEMKKIELELERLEDAAYGFPEGKSQAVLIQCLDLAFAAIYCHVHLDRAKMRQQCPSLSE
jgi:hypothetical protein